MAREINRAEAWERAHEIFTQVNFNAFDYNTIKESLLDYLKLYYPEDFTDYIESSEMIAILELFAYVGELIAYRLDLNAHENFITTAQRKESILRLAKLISYKASRNIPARGLVKMSSIQTTENVIDSQGRNLAGRRIYWNDSNNDDWREQFILVLNRILEQEYGTVAPNERVQVNDVLFELYSMNNTPFGPQNSAIIPFSADANNQNAPMEITPLELIDSGPQERRPEENAKFSLVYANDGLGDGSDTSGFLMFVKQGTLARQTSTFDGVTPNQHHEVLIDNINETDVWVNNVDPDTGIILTDDPSEDLIPHLVADDLRFGEWIEVDLANAQNIIFNTNRNRHKYEIETLDNDQIRVIFGDGEFSDIPSGTFHTWYRTSLNDDYYIEKTSVVDKLASIPYLDAVGSVQTISFGFSLVSSLQNASASEDIEHIRRVAPSVYYTQDRMVNGRDYNTFMLQDPTILKLRAINRTFSGDSKYIAWHDPRENYEDVKLFGDDLAMYWVEDEPSDENVQFTVPESSDILNLYIEPQLSSNNFYMTLAPVLESLGYDGTDIRTLFTEAEQIEINDAIADLITSGGSFDINVGILLDGTQVWSTQSPANMIILYPTINTTIKMFVISQIGFNTIDISYRSRRMVVQSSTTKFWNANTSEVVNFDTLNTRGDTVVILQANVSADGTSLLDANRNYVVVGQELQADTLPDTQRLAVIPADTDLDGYPDNILQPSIMQTVIEGTWSTVGTVDGPEYYIDLGEKKINNSIEKGFDNDVEVLVDGIRLTYADSELVIGQPQATDLLLDRVYLSAQPAGSATVKVTIKEFVYFQRIDALNPWYPVDPTEDVRIAYMSEDNADPNDDKYIRYQGRYPLNFAWFHYTPRLNLVDPAASNIIDVYVITKGYYTALVRWLENRTEIEPTEPTPLELRTSYAEMLDNKMISDTVVLHPGSFKILFGSRAIPQLQVKFKVVRPVESSLTDNQVKVQIVNAIRQFFDIETWEFGESFFATELFASIHAALGAEIDSIVLVPSYASDQFGDLFQVTCKEDEIFIPDISTTDIEIVTSLTPENMRQY